MVDRLTSLDASFLYMEESTTAMHVGGVLLFDPPADGKGFEYDHLVELIGERMSLIPRYRQKVKEIPGHLGTPVWVDDSDFDLRYHVRRSALPKPGNMDQLREFTGRLMGRHLDRKRPLWELYLVEGLENGRTALISKTHHAMVDGISGVDIIGVILDVGVEPRESPVEKWRAGREPGGLELLIGTGLDLLRSPVGAIDTVRNNIGDLRATAGKLATAGSGVLATVRTSVSPAPSSPLNANIGSQRRFGMADTDLDDYKRIRKAHGGTVNDVVLAVVAGGLRSWLLTRAESVTRATIVRAMVPVSVRSEEQSGALGNRVSSYFVDLPVGEADPVIRLNHVSYAMQGHKDSNQAVGAETLVALSGFAPPTLTSLGARAASRLSSRLFNLVVTNVPGPQFPLYAAGAPMTAMYPVVPLAKGQAVVVGLMSYNGGIYYGLNADREAMWDVDVLATCISESLAELLATVK